MNTKFKILNTILSLTLALAILLTPTVALAAENVEAGTELDELPAGETIEINNGSIGTNNGSIGTNNGVIDTCNGQVTKNNGDINWVAEGALVVTNTADGDDFYIRDNWGEVRTNLGKILNNMGTVPNNQGAISSNSGSVGTNSGEILTTDSNSVIGNNTGTVITNQGRIEQNEGTVEYNLGIIESNSATVNDNESNGVIEENNGSVNLNLGTITQKDAGRVKNNFGTITGGTVENNYGTVIGGTVENNFGTVTDSRVTYEYYRVSFTFSGPVHVPTNNEALRADPEGGYRIRQGDSSLQIAPALPVGELIPVLNVEITGNLDRYEAGENYTWNLFGVKGDIAISVTVNYETLSGNGQVWTKGDDSLHFDLRAPYERFLYAEYRPEGGSPAKLQPGDFSIRQGAENTAEFILNESFLATLDPGEHTIAVGFGVDDTSLIWAQISFTVEAPGDVSTPNTGDNSNIVFWIALLFISGGLSVTLTVADRKRKSIANK